MRTIILAIGIGGLLYLTGGFSAIARGEIFGFLVQKFDITIVIQAIPVPIWITTIVLDIIDVIKK